MRIQDGFGWHDYSCFNFFYHYSFICHHSEYLYKAAIHSLSPPPPPTPPTSQYYFQLWALYVYFLIRKCESLRSYRLKMIGIIFDIICSPNYFRLFLNCFRPEVKMQAVIVSVDCFSIEAIKMHEIINKKNSGFFLSFLARSSEIFRTYMNISHAHYSSFSA